MTSPTSTRLHILEETAISEASAARELKANLVQIRAAATRLNANRFEAALDAARTGAQRLREAGLRRSESLAELAASLGLSPVSTVREVAECTGSSSLASAASELAGALVDLSQETATLGICVRYGATSTSQLLEFRRNATGAYSLYGPTGLVGQSRTPVGHRV